MFVSSDRGEFYVFRYDGKLNDIEKAAVLLCWPADAFGESYALTAFLCMNPALSTSRILELYIERWNVETFLSQISDKKVYPSKIHYPSNYPLVGLYPSIF
jgi:hypothetical protein